MSKEIRYQWARGDNTGLEEIFDKEEGEYIVFKSGRRISSELLNEYMLLLDDNGPMDMSPSAGVTTVNFTQDDSNYSDNKITKSIHPRDILGNNNHNTNPTSQINVQPTKKEVSPIKLLINQAIKDEIDVEIKYKIKLPKKGVYSIIKDSFEVDIDKEILDILKSDLDIENLKKIFEEQILEKVKSHYKQ